ncbi:hypothetical protein [Pseudomonas sp. TMB3-21]
MAEDGASSFCATNNEGSIACLRFSGKALPRQQLRLELENTGQA